MPNALNIKESDPKIPSWWLFEELRERGLEHIAEFSGELWTDHNVHDPGITILEVLCYAITDLGYRTNLDIEDLLAQEYGKEENNFFTPEQILTCNPLTILDYRKMLVDIPGVRNAWLVPANEQEVPLYIDCKNDHLHFSPVENEVEEDIGELILNGLYKVYLDIDPVLGAGDNTTCGSDSNVVDEVLKNVKKRLQNHRNLCEDFLDIIVLQDEEIRLCSDIELEPNANPNTVLEAMFEAIDNFLSPRLNFYSLKEMLEKEKSMEEIFEGRPYTPAYGDKSGKFSHGFIDTDQLISSFLPERIMASDLYRVIMDVEGVRAIKSLLIFNFKDGIARTNGEAWALELTKNHRPLFSPENSEFNFTKGVIRLKQNKEQAVNRFKKRLQDFQKNKFKPTDLDLRVPYGNYRSDLAEYPSIQHEFPLVYGIGKGHLSEKAPQKRKVEALQLKAYLTFYDQLLAGYLSQLSNVRQLFSWDISADSPAQTFFQQPVVGIPKEDKIFLSVGQSGQVEWVEGDVLAIPVDPFLHPTERDMAIIQMIELFRTYSSDQGEDIIEAREDDDGNYRYVVIGTNAKPVLQSNTTYETKEKALLASEVLFFQGTLEESYEHTNWPELSEYSFSFVYKKVKYEEYLKTITETEEKYYTRKDNFLNHLLARFGEQFTEYVLLMYALNQEASDPQDIIQDKARFLKNYPDISRNRGRGFDYTNKENNWNSKENLSGYEKRVAGLMGLDQWERRNLNNFEVLIREQQYFLTIKDHRGTLLFESEECYDLNNPDEIPEILISEFADLLCDIDCYKTFDCINEKVFGFYLEGKDGKTFAKYVRTFGSIALRDEILACTQNYFNGNPFYQNGFNDLNSDDAPETKYFLGQSVKIIAEQEGFYFLLMDAGMQEVYLKSSIAYKSKEEACYAWVAFAPLAKNKNNYIDSKDNYEGGPYSFVIYKPAKEGEEQEEFAFHPKGYSSKAVRTKKKNIISKFVSDKKLEYEIHCQPDFYSWSYLDENGQALLNSFHKFKTTEQALAGWSQFKNYGSKWTDYRKKDSAEGYSFSIYKEEVQIAFSIQYLTDEERNEALEKMLKKIQSGFSEEEEELCVEVKTHEGKFFFVVLDEHGKQTLIGKQLFENSNAAACAYYHFLEKAADNSFYEEVTQTGTCFFSFIVKNGDSELAYHPEYYIKEEKETVQNNLITYIKNNKIPFNLELLPGSHHYEIAWENCEGECKTLFLENNGDHLDAVAAQNEAIAFLEYYDENNPDQWGLIEDNGKFSFAIKNVADNIILAEHPEFYSTEKERDTVLEDARTYMNRYKDLINDPDDFFKELIKPTIKWDVCNEACEENDEEACLMSGFQLCKTDQPIACHPTTFDNLDDQNKALNQLLFDAKCDNLFYSDLCIQGSKIISEIEDKYYFDLWANNASILLWRSAASYNSKEEAATAFQENWLKIIELARNSDHYRLPDPDNPYLSLWDGEQHIANFPSNLTSESELSEAKGQLVKIAKQYPVFATVGGYRFRILNEACTKELWQSSIDYNSEKETLLEFSFFLSLLKNKTNYRRNNNKEACIFKIEIGETLLESNRTYADVFITNNTVFLGQNFANLEDAEAGLTGIFNNLRNAQIPNLTTRDHIIADQIDQKFYYKLNLGHSGLAPDWRSETGYNTQTEALAAMQGFLDNRLDRDNFHIIGSDNTGFSIIIKDIDIKNPPEGGVSDESTTFAACPAIYKSDEIHIGGDTVLVSNDCTDFENEPCITTICPAAWDLGLQDFLIYAIKEENYYSFIDYHQNCQLGFRVVTDKYRIARNPKEFHQPAKQSEFKDWLYGYSRCNKDVNIGLPDAKIIKKNGMYHYYLEGDPEKVSWCSVDDFPDTDTGKEDAKSLFDAQYKEVFCLAKKRANYKIQSVEPGIGPMWIELNDGETGDAVAVLTSQNSYQDTQSAEKAIQCFIIFAQTFCAQILSGNTKKINYSTEKITKEDADPIVECWKYCIHIPELLWISYQGYEEEENANLAFVEDRFDFFAYAQEVDFYELGKEESSGAGRPLQLLKEDCSVLATSFQTYQNETEWNEAVLNRVLLARKFPYFKYNNKYGFQCFALENVPGYEESEGSNCIIDTSNIISVTIPGEVIWESIPEFDSPDDVQCTFVDFLDLLKDKSNYQSIQLEDCNLFGLEITQPKAVLATHPQRYFTNKELQDAIARTQECINAEGFHLIEHILLRPKKGISNHFTIQFMACEEMDCSTSELTTIIDYDGDLYAFHPLKPWVLEHQSSVDYLSDQEKNSIVQILNSCLVASVSSEGLFDPVLFKSRLEEEADNLFLFDDHIDTFVNAFDQVINASIVLQGNQNWAIFECLEKDAPKYYPLRLLQDKYTDGIIAESKKVEIIAYLEQCMIELTTDGQSITREAVGDKLSKQNTHNFISGNSHLFIETILKEIERVELNTGSFKDIFESLIFCFNKSEKDSKDKLIPNCPDCENIELLPLEEASDAACEDPKQLLAESKNATTPTESSALGTYYVAGADPYSFWTTIILPYWPQRFQNANFRNFFENTLRREAPAHIGLRICWLDPKQMRTFERAYRNWLEAFSGNENCNLEDAQHRLICILFDEEDGISNVYPPARLQEGGCGPSGTSDPGAVLLDFTQLG